MVGSGSAPTISLRERSLRMNGPEEKLSKWVVFSLFTHGGLIALLFIMPWLPSRKPPSYPIYTVDLVGGEKIGGTNFGTELPTPASKKSTPEKAQPEAASVPVKEKKPEPKKEKIEKKTVPEKSKAAPVLPENKLAMKEPTKKESPKKEVKRDTAGEASGESSADRVRERLIQSAVERAKNRTESSSKAGRGEVISSGPGEGEGAAALGPGGRGGGVVKGMDFIVYQNRMLSTIKDNWAWVGQKSNLRVVVHFNIKDNGEIVGLRIVQPSGDPSYDESVLRAVKKSSPLPAPPETVRQDFAEVELSFRPKDLGA